jgi:hypothetical protein
VTISELDPWKLCELGSYPNGSQFSVVDARFWASKDSSGNLMLFVQELDRVEVKDILKDIFSGLVLYQDKNIKGTRFVIKLEAKDLKDKFIVVCNSIINESGGYIGEDLYQFIYNELISWSAFMRPKRVGLTHEIYTGLWGELAVVNDYYIKKFGVQNFMDNWTGIANTPQDLSACDFTLEVKSTFTITPKTISISSLEQLDAPVNNQALAYLRLSKSPVGRSLNELILSIESLMKFNTFELTRFRRVVSELVCDASEEQMKQKNIILAKDCFEIRDDFPCLRRSTTNISIAKAEYKILLQALTPYKFENGIEGFFERV